MIDPKMVELSAYGDLPHLRHPVVTDPRDAAGVLKWAVLEMERRYQMLSMRGVRSIGEFNQRVLEGPSARRARSPRPGEPPVDPFRDDSPLPYIVVVVDELADLMMTVQAEIEKPLAQLAQKARAIGIHLIVATQRPSVNVITGLIKANFPTRIAFRVASKTDSRTILDQNGAEALLGNGDMLFLPPGGSEPVRIQGAFISTSDTDDLLHWFREQAVERAAEAGAVGAQPELQVEPDILEEVRKFEAMDAAGGDGPEAIRGEWDELFRSAAEICVQHDQGSTSLLQRRLKIGYGRAARIVDQLHEAGVLGPPEGSKPRDVLVSLSELDSLFPGT
jgi:S-DNA-T family DNA segregation ATPase FtsK/SpoIIIE